MAWGLDGQAQGLLRRVADARPHQPETYRALAECVERMGNTDLAILIYEVTLRGAWDARFGAFKFIVAMDYARCTIVITCTIMNPLRPATRSSGEKSERCSMARSYSYPPLIY